MSQQRSLTIINSDGSIGSLQVEISIGRVCTIQHGDEQFAGSDLFAALENFRLKLEQEHIQVVCNGAREDVYPSGMCRDMGSGSRAYILKPNQRPTLKDLVNIFDAAEPSQVTSVAAQQAYWEAWLDSFSK